MVGSHLSHACCRSGVYTDATCHICPLCGLGLRHEPKERPTSYKAILGNNLFSSTYGRDNGLEKSISLSPIGHFNHAMFIAINTAMFIVVSLFNHRYISNSCYLMKNKYRRD